MWKVVEKLNQNNDLIASLLKTIMLKSKQTMVSKSIQNTLKLNLKLENLEKLRV